MTSGLGDLGTVTFLATLVPGEYEVRLDDMIAFDLRCDWGEDWLRSLIEPGGLVAMPDDWAGTILGLHNGERAIRVTKIHTLGQTFIP
jgi:hypothetical protein